MLIYVKKRRSFSSDRQTDVQLKTTVQNLTKTTDLRSRRSY